MKKYNIIVSLITSLVGIGMIFFVRQFEFKGFYNIGPGLWPRFLGGLMILLSGILLIQTLLSKDESKKIDFSTIGMKRVLLMIIIMVVFSVLLYFFGMVLGIIFLIPATISVFGEFDKKKIVITTVGITIFVYVVFEMLLQVGLPSGRLFK